MGKGRRTEEEGNSGSPAWMSTFSDLMNLLLCFFVLLFSMSSIDQEKFEEVVASLNASFSIFDGGATSITEGNLISSGISQLNDFNDYYSQMGMTMEEQEGNQIASMEEYKEQLADENLEASEELGEAIEESLAASGISGDVDIEVEELYVQLTLNGSLLFTSGSADLRTESLDTVSKLGDILLYYEDYIIQIIGYTDTVPQNPGSKYADNWELSSGRAYTVLRYLREQKGMSEEKLECMGRGENDPVASNDTAEGREMNRRVEIRIYNSIYSGVE